MFRHLVIAAILVCSASPSVLAEDGENGSGIKLVNPQTIRWKVGVVVTAENGPALGVVASAPVPEEWPEQQVKIVETDKSPHVRRIGYRDLDGGGRQMLVSIPRLDEGETATASIVFEVTKSAIQRPDDASEFQLPSPVPSALRMYLAPSPLIESQHNKIRSLAAEIVDGKNGAWEQAEAIYDWVREHVQYKEGTLKGALAALNDGTGDCEELTSLFIALCRANGIPARTVWVPGHCYPEFYLEDNRGRGVWIPCQAAGERDFGNMSEARMILQKGDNIKVPEISQRLRYAQATLKSTNRRGTAQPTMRHVVERIESQP